MMRETVKFWVLKKIKKIKLGKLSEPTQSKDLEKSLNLYDITQHEWEYITKTGKLTQANITAEQWYNLYDLWIDKMGLKGKIISKNKLLKDYCILLCDYIENPTQPQYKLRLKKAELDSNQKVKNIGRDKIYPALVKEFGQIDKKTITVEDYTDLYLELRDGTK